MSNNELTNLNKIQLNNLDSSPEIWLKGKYRNEIDGLRSLAVISATIHNFWESLLPCGYLGVDMFAVVSGFCFVLLLFLRPLLFSLFLPDQAPWLASVG